MALPCKRQLDYEGKLGVLYEVYSKPYTNTLIMLHLLILTTCTVHQSVVSSECQKKTTTMKNHEQKNDAKYTLN